MNNEAPKNKLKMVLIEWIDSQFMVQDSCLIDDVDDVAPFISAIIGWLVKEDDENYYLAKLYFKSSDCVKYIHIIPKCSAIIRIVELKEGKVLLKGKERKTQ